VFQTRVVDFENHGGGICHNLNVNFRPHLDVKNHRDENFYDGRYNGGRGGARASR
jgi:hypothetical protein